jgi:C-terminal processing protease CtpA/Prc
MFGRICAYGFALLALVTLAPEPAQAQNPNCPEGQKLEGDLGIEGISCRNCTLRTGRGQEDVWRFRAEPEVLSIRAGSPAAGKLKAGDVITAIDGELITTPEGGRHFANIGYGERVTLTIRRGSKASRVEMVAAARCREPSPPLPEEPSPSFAPLPSSDIPEPLPPTLPADIWPSGWFGFSVSCYCDIESSGADKPAIWSFKEPPEIQSVERDSPADRAGLERGDELLEIDGVRLTTAGGGRRFGSVRAGETVYFTYRRGDRTEIVSMQALPRPLAEFSGLKELDPAALREALAQSERAVEAERSALEAFREQAQRNQQLRLEEITKRLEEQQRLSRRALEALYRKLASSTASESLGPEHVRYAGSVGDVNVEVRGGASVLVTVVKENEEIVIVTNDARIVLKAAK